MNKFVVMSGGFHPFHAGHASLYQQAKQAFPDATVLVCATDVQKDRPFPFEIKKKLAQLSGVPENDFIQVSRQFSAEDPALLERIGNLDNAIVIFVRSEKDKDEQPQGLPLNPAKDKIPVVSRGPNKGKPIKLLDYDVNRGNLLPASQHTYIGYLQTVEFGPGIKSASEIRKLWPTLADKDKLLLIYSLYPKTLANENLAKLAIQLLDIGILGNHTLKEQDNKNQSSGEEAIFPTDPESETILKFAQQHYPGTTKKQAAFIKYVQRALRHSEEDDKLQDKQIQQIQTDIRDIKSQIQNESIDFLEEK